MITHITAKETELTNTLRTTTEALTLVAAERDALQSKNELFESALLKVRVSLGLNLHSNDDLLEVIDALRADAERYRWLRGAGHVQQNIIAHYAGVEMDMKCDAMRGKS